MGTHWLFNSLDEACALHLPRFSGSLCSSTVPRVCSQESVAWCSPTGMWYTSTVMLRDERQIHSLNWQRSDMIDWWAEEWMRQGSERKKDFSKSIFIAPGCQRGLVTISCWYSLDSLSLCVQDVFVSTMLNLLLLCLSLCKWGSTKSQTLFNHELQA